MSERLRFAWNSNAMLRILTILALLLIFAGFVLPPCGVIDGSVLTAVGEIFGFAALWTLVKAIEKGVDAKVTHNNTTIEINNDEQD